jgi:precorrin-2 dehydrogenase / sirohydrochlorin ferrochelatase
MPLYPVNLRIADRPCLVLGGGPVALRKVESLLLCGARVRVVSPDAVDEIQALAVAGRIEWCRRRYIPGDLQGIFLAIAATDNPFVQRQISEEAAALPVLLNSADDPDTCDFQVPSSVRRNDLLITISTGGASPALARQIRKKLEQEFGWEYGVLVTLLASLREIVVRDGNDTGTNTRLFYDVLGIDSIQLIRRAAWDDLQCALVEILPGDVDAGVIVRRCIEVAEQRDV